MFAATLALLAPIVVVEAAIQVDFSIANNHAERIAENKAKVAGVVKAGKRTSQVPELNASLTPSYNFYHGTVLVGSPPQKLDMLFDTGSPVSWVYGPEGSYAGAARFFPNESSTFIWGNESFSASYGSGNYLGHWGSDLVGTAVSSDGNNGTSLVPFELGIVSSFATTAGAPGLLGLGPHIESAGPSNYSTLPEALYENNITESPAFSVYLEGDGGKFIFGGIDMAHVNPPFYNFSSTKSYGNSVTNSNSALDWHVQLESLSLNHGEPHPVTGLATLDTGSPISLVPPQFAAEIAQFFGLSNYSKYEAWYTNKSADSMLGWVTFNLTGGLCIDIATEDLFIPGELIWLDDGPANVTALSFVGSANTLLGDAFFRHVYTVFNSATREVWLSRRNQNVNDTDVVPVASVSPWPVAEQTVTVTTIVEVQTVTGTAPVLQNKYLGTVNEKAAATMTSAMTDGTTDSSATATATASGSESTTSLSVSTTATSKASSGSASASSSSSQASSTASNAAAKIAVAGLPVALLALI